jgi:hypothetical protein
MFIPRILPDGIEMLSGIEDWRNVARSNEFARDTLDRLEFEVRHFVEAGGSVTLSEWKGLSVIEQDMLRELRDQYAQKQHARMAIMFRNHPDNLVEILADLGDDIAREAYDETCAAEVESIPGVG